AIARARVPVGDAHADTLLAAQDRADVHSGGGLDERRRGVGAQELGALDLEDAGDGIDHFHVRRSLWLGLGGSGPSTRRDAAVDYTAIAQDHPVGPGPPSPPFAAVRGPRDVTRHHGRSDLPCGTPRRNSDVEIALARQSGRAALALAGPRVAAHGAASSRRDAPHGILFDNDTRR